MGQVQAEKEDVAARLHGAENVRDFLMDKLRDLEDALTDALDTSSKKDAQAALDREIIGFLDAKTREYERALERLTTENDAFRRDLARVHDDHAAKLSVRTIGTLRHRQKAF